MFILSFSVCRLQYKYSKLMMSSGGKECELPTADSCAIIEGEDAEDDIMYLTKKSFFTKIKSYSREVSNPSIHTHIELCTGQLFMLYYYQCVFRGRQMDLIRYHLSQHLHTS